MVDINRYLNFRYYEDLPKGVDYKLKFGKLSIVFILCLVVSSCSLQGIGASGEKGKSSPCMTYWQTDLPARVMLKEDITLRCCPVHDTKSYVEASYFLVTVITTVRTDNFENPDEIEGLWALVLLPTLDTAMDNVGWVPYRDLEVYTEENKHLLRYPVHLRDGTVDLDTGEEVKWDEVLVEYEDDYAIVMWEGGNIHKVSVDSIVYPDVHEINEIE